jgi:hypothetical protein
MFKPQVTIITEETRRDYANSYGRNRSPYKTIQYKTYRELKKNLKKHLQESIEDTVSVVRSKHDWGWGYGEWYEHWALERGKPVIVKEGWS